MVVSSPSTPYSYDKDPLIYVYHQPSHTTFHYSLFHTTPTSTMSSNYQHFDFRSNKEGSDFIGWVESPYVVSSARKTAENQGSRSHRCPMEKHGLFGRGQECESGNEDLMYSKVSVYDLDFPEIIRRLPENWKNC